GAGAPRSFGRPAQRIVRRPRVPRDAERMAELVHERARALLRTERPLPGAQRRSEKVRLFRRRIGIERHRDRVRERPATARELDHTLLRPHVRAIAPRPLGRAEARAREREACEHHEPSHTRRFRGSIVASSTKNVTVPSASAMPPSPYIAAKPKRSITRPKLGPPINTPKSKSAVKSASVEPRFSSGVRLTTSPNRIGKVKPWPMPHSTPASTRLPCVCANAIAGKPSVSAASAGASTRFGPTRSGSQPKKIRSTSAAPVYAPKNRPTLPIPVSSTKRLMNTKKAVS